MQATARNIIALGLPLLALLGVCLPIAAQKNAPVGGGEAGRMLQVFVGTYAATGLKSEAQLQALIDLTDPGLTFQITTVALSGNKKFRNGDAVFWLQFLRQMHTEGGAEVVRVLKKIEIASVRPTSVYANIHFEFTHLTANKPIVKGDEFLHVLLRKVDETQWRIIDIRSMMIETEKFRGTCLCEIFTSKTSPHISAKITVPSGTHYRASTVVFELHECDPRQKTFLVRVGNRDFRWLATGQLLLLKDNSKCNESTVPPEVVSTALERNEMITAIIRKYLFEFECAQITFK